MSITPPNQKKNLKHIIQPRSHANKTKSFVVTRWENKRRIERRGTVRPFCALNGRERMQLSLSYNRVGNISKTRAESQQEFWQMWWEYIWWKSLSWMQLGGYEPLLIPLEMDQICRYMIHALTRFAILSGNSNPENKYKDGTSPWKESTKKINCFIKMNEPTWAHRLLKCSVIVAALAYRFFFSMLPSAFEHDIWGPHCQHAFYSCQHK